MNEYQPRIVTAPAMEPVTLDEAKIDLRVDHDDDDMLIANLIVACRQEAEELSRRAFITRTYDLPVARWPANDQILLPYPPVASVTSITYYDETNAVATMTSADYILISDIEPAIITLAYQASWPDATLRTVSPIRVRFVTGYGASAANVPERYRALIRSLVAIRYESRDEMTASQERQLANIQGALKMEWGW